MVIDEEIFQTIIDNLHDGVYFVDTRRVIQRWSAGATRITGYTADEVRGHSCADNILVHVDDMGRSMCQGMCPLAATIKDGKPRNGHYYLKHKDGHRVPVTVFAAPLRDSDGAIVGALETFHDESDLPYSIAEVARLDDAVYLCPLSGVPNRRYIDEILPLKFEEMRRAGKRLGVVVADIDHFKKVNDAYGHETGDIVLKMVGRTLAHAMRRYDVLARWGGEEFVAVLTLDRPLDLLPTAERLRVLVETSSRTISRDKLHVTISIGAVAADATIGWPDALRLAEQRLLESKRSGRNRTTAS